MPIIGSRREAKLKKNPEVIENENKYLYQGTKTILPRVLQRSASYKNASTRSF